MEKKYKLTKESIEYFGKTLSRIGKIDEVETKFGKIGIFPKKDDEFIC